MRKAVRIYILLFPLSFLIFFSCQNDVPEWQDTDFDISDIKLDTVKAEDIFISNVSFKTSAEKMTSGIDESFSLTFHDNYYGKEITSYSFYHNALYFKNFNEDDEFYMTYLNINSETNHLSISINDFTIDTETKPKDLEAAFPKSYYWRNLGIPIATFEISKKYNRNKIQLEYIRTLIVNDKNEWIGILEFTFIDKELKYIIFDAEGALL